MLKKTNKKEIRLASFLAQSGVASRRHSEELIKQGKIKVNGQIVKLLSTKVAVDAISVEFNNKPVRLDNKVYYLLNKPWGYVCSVSDAHNPQTVLSLVPPEPKVFPVGRLDKDSQGLILLTNDGDLAYRLTHPKFKVPKTYAVSLDKTFKPADKAQLLVGIKLDEGLAQADKVVIKNQKDLMIILHQGYKRQIRRMLESLGYQVLSLIRVAEGHLVLGSLPEGEYIILDKSAVEKV